MRHFGDFQTIVVSNFLSNTYAFYASIHSKLFFGQLFSGSDVMYRVA